MGLLKRNIQYGIVDVNISDTNGIPNWSHFQNNPMENEISSHQGVPLIPTNSLWILSNQNNLICERNNIFDIGPLKNNDAKFYSNVFIGFCESNDHVYITSITIEPVDDKTYNKTYVTSKDSDQTVHLPSMARVLVYPSLDTCRPEAVKGACDQWGLWSDCADAEADLSLRWSHKTYCRFWRALAQIISECFKYSIWNPNGDRDSKQNKIH